MPWWGGCGVKWRRWGRVVKVYEEKKLWMEIKEMENKGYYGRNITCKCRNV
jgi:hypothetical protein